MLVFKIEAEVGTNVVQLPLGIKSSGAAGIFAHRLKLAGVTLASEAKRISPRDTGRLSNSHAYAVDDKSLRLLVFNRVGYSTFVHEGRRPGKPPPTAALIPWVRRRIVNDRLSQVRAAGKIKGISTKASATKGEREEAKRVAFLIARAIGRRGTKPRRWFADVLADKGRAVVEDNMFRAAKNYAALVADAIARNFEGGGK